MSYVLTGKLYGMVTSDLREPLSNMTVRIYRIPERGIPDPRSGSAALDEQEVREKEYVWIGQAWTNERGEFTLDLSERSLLGHRGSTRAYEGGPLQLDVYCREVPGQTPGSTEEVQFTVATFLPDWESIEDGERAEFEHTLSQDVWREVRTAMDSWVISGRVAARSTALPMPGLRVFAYDADIAQDDALGSGVTDSEGNFRIDFRGQAFRVTPVPKIELEGKGPDLYFRIETEDGKVLTAENRTRAGDPNRKDVLNLFSTELLVDL